MKEERPQASVDESIEKAISFLAEHQFASGEFVTYFSGDEEMKEWCATDSTIFMTALIAQCLMPLDSKNTVNDILVKAQWFLKAQAMEGGVFHFFAKNLILFRATPPDMDDTVTAGLFLRSRNIGVPDPTPLVLSNRNKNGLFYTWFSPRFSYSKNRNVWRIRLRFLKNPFETLLARFQNEFTFNDLDFVVNVNVLLFLGNTPAAKPVISFIKNTLDNNKELSSDNWYHNPFIIYFLCSRLFSLQIPDLEYLRQVVFDRLHKIIRVEEMRPLELATAISAILNTGITSPKIENLVKRLIDSQSENGSWPRMFFYMIPSKKIGWGCEELTTGFATEALWKYTQFRGESSTTK